MSDATFAVMRSQVRLAARLDLPAISTGRPFAFYRKVFFDGRGEADVLAELRGRVIADVGCGLTPFVPNSMFQACHRAGIEFYGVDPKLDGGLRLGRFDRFKTAVNGGATPDPNAPGADRRVASLAGDLPFEDGSVDLMLSSFLLFVWLVDDAPLTDIFEEALRVLRPGGTLQIYPTPRWTEGRIGPRLWELVSRRMTVRQVFFGSPDIANLPPGFTTSFRAI